MISAIFFLLFSHSSSASTQLNPSQPETIFILAGQSNMAGRGGTNATSWDGFVPPECQPSPWILRLSAELAWEPAREPLHRDIDVPRVCGVGPGMAFANSVLSRAPDVGTVGLVPCAVGSTNMSDWSRGSALYDMLIRRTEAAARGGGKIRGMLWYQGESDAMNREDAVMYKQRLEKFFTDVRSDLQSPLLLIIQVALDSGSGSGQYTDIVRKAQLEIDMTNVKCVDAIGLKAQGDGVHLTTEAQVQLGKILANSYLHFNALLPFPSIAHFCLWRFLFIPLIALVLIILDQLDLLT